MRSGRWALVVLLLCTPAAAQTLVFRDTFTSNDPTPGCFPELGQHVADMGGSWELNENSSGNPTKLIKIGIGRDWLSPCSADVGLRVSYVINTTTPLSADYTLRFLLADAVSGGQWSFGGALIRRTAADTFYGFGMRPRGFPLAGHYDHDAVLWKSVGGVVTDLDTCNCDIHAELGDPTNPTLEFGAVGNYVFVKVNGSVVLDAMDASIAGPGKPGVLTGAYKSPNDKAAPEMAWDDVEVWDMGGTPPPPPPPPDPQPTLTPVESWVLPSGVLRFCASDARCWGDLLPLP